MKKFAHFLLKNKVYIIILFILCIALSVVGFLNTGINSDITHYLDENTMTSKGYKKLSEVFDIKGDANIGISNVSYETVSDIVDYLSTFTYINDRGEEELLFTQISWVGSFEAINDYLNSDDESLNAFIKTELLKTYDILKNKFYIEESDTYIISTYLNLVNTETRVGDALYEIEDYLEDLISSEGGEFYMGGGANSSRRLLASSIGEIPKYFVIAVIFITLILLFTTKSYLEPLVYLLTLGIAIVLNLGSNIILGSVSSITLSSSTILQLALSMDYSIFLMHTYYEEKKKTVNSKEAMLNAIPRTLITVSASAITTIGGFIAILFMQFGMGYDLGMVLAKGVFLSLLTVIILQPVLIILLDKPISKTSHKYFQPRLKRTGNFAIRHKKVIITICLIIAIPCFIGQFFAPLSYLKMDKPSVEKNDTQLVMEQMGNQLILVVPIAKEADGSNNWTTPYKIARELTEIEGVTEVFSIYNVLSSVIYFGAMQSGNEMINEMLGSMIVDEIVADGETPSKAYTLFTLSLVEMEEEDASYDIIHSINRISDKYCTDIGGIYITGTVMAAYDLALVTPSDFNKVAIISALFIFIILALAFRDIILALILLLVIELGIWLNLSIVALPNILTMIFGGLSGKIELSHVNFIAYIIISSIQLGATVDYAILLTTKFRESIKTMCAKDAVKDMIYRGTPSVIVSASVLITACISVNLITSNLIVAQITELIARGAIISSILVVTLLPAILVAVYSKQDKYKLLAVASSDDAQVIADDNLVSNSISSEHILSDNKTDVSITDNITSDNKTNALGIDNTQEIIDNTNKLDSSLDKQPVTDLIDTDIALLKNEEKADAEKEITILNINDKNESNDKIIDKSSNKPSDNTSIKTSGKTNDKSINKTINKSSNKPSDKK